MYKYDKEVMVTTVDGHVYLNRTPFKGLFAEEAWEEIKEEYRHVHGFEDIEVEVTAICLADDDNKIHMDFYYGFRDYGLRDYAFGICCDGYDYIEESIKRFVSVVLSEYLYIDFLLGSLFSNGDCCD